MARLQYGIVAERIYRALQHYRMGYEGNVECSMLGKGRGFGEILSIVNVCTGNYLFIIYCRFLCNDYCVFLVNEWCVIQGSRGEHPPLR